MNEHAPILEEITFAFQQPEVVAAAARRLIRAIIPKSISKTKHLYQKV
jgi:hypothetical protein